VNISFVFFLTSFILLCSFCYYTFTDFFISLFATTSFPFLPPFLFFFVKPFGNKLFNLDELTASTPLRKHYKNQNYRIERKKERKRKNRIR